MIKFKNLFQFNQKEIDLAFKAAKMANKTAGLKLLQANLSAIPTMPITTTSKQDDKKYGKILIITPAKSGKANERNLLRRRIKDIFYKEKLYQKPVISILLVYKAAMKLDFGKLKEFLMSSFK